MNNKNIKADYIGSEDITDINSENKMHKDSKSEIVWEKSTERRQLPDRKSVLKKKPNESLVNNSRNKTLRIGYSEGLSDYPDGKYKW